MRKMGNNNKNKGWNKENILSEKRFFFSFNSSDNVHSSYQFAIFCTLDTQSQFSVFLARESFAKRLH